MKLDFVMRKFATFDYCGRGAMHLFTFHFSCMQPCTQVCMHAGS